MGNMFSARAPVDANVHSGAIAVRERAVQIAGHADANVHAGAIARGAMQVDGRANANVHAGAIAQGAVQSNVDANVHSGAIAPGAVEATVHSDAVRGNAEVHSGAFQMLGVAPRAVELQAGAIRGIEEGAFKGMFRMVNNIDMAVLPILLCGGALVSIMFMVLLMLADPKSLLGQLLLGLLEGGKLIPLLALCGATACCLRLRETEMTLHAMRRESALKDTMLANKEETLEHLQTENATMKVDIANKDQTIQRLQIDFATMQGRSVNTDETLRHLLTENVTMKGDLANKEQTLQRLQIEIATHEEEALQRFQNELATVNETAEEEQEAPPGPDERAQIPAHAEGAEISLVYQAEGDLCDLGFAVDAVRFALEVSVGEYDAALQMLLDEADVA